MGTAKCTDIILAVITTLLCLLPYSNDAVLFAVLLTLCLALHIGDRHPTSCSSMHFHS